MNTLNIDANLDLKSTQLSFILILNKLGKLGELVLFFNEIAFSCEKLTIFLYNWTLYSLMLLITPKRFKRLKISS